MPTRRGLGGALVVASALLAAGCGGGADSVPRGAPSAVVRAAPERTRREGTARVVTADGPRTTTMVVDLRVGSPDPGAHALDLMRDPLRVVSFGGQEVRGIGAFKYDVDVLLGGHRTRIGVWVDSRGRVRRIELPSQPPATVRRGLPRVTTIDYVEFGTPLPEKRKRER